MALIESLKAFYKDNVENVDKLNDADSILEVLRAKYGNYKGSNIEEYFKELVNNGISPGGGGGGGDYPTVTVNVDAEKLYCELGFQPEYDPLSETNIAVTALYDTGTFYTYTFSLPSVDLNDGVTLEFLLIGDSFTLIPWADFSLPNAVSITGSATFDNETHSITVTGDCSIHLIGFDE